MKLIKKIEVVCMNGGGWNATIPRGPWATGETPEKALELLLAHIAANPEYRLAADNREENGE